MLTRIGGIECSGLDSCKKSVEDAVGRRSTYPMLAASSMMEDGDGDGGGGAGDSSVEEVMIQSFFYVDLLHFLWMGDQYSTRVAVMQWTRIAHKGCRTVG